MWELETEIVQIPADPSLAEQFGISEGTLVNRVFRIKTANGQPIAHMTDYVPQSVLSIDHLKRQFKGSVLDILLVKGSPPADYTSVALTARQGTPEITKALHIEAATPLLFTQESGVKPKVSCISVTPGIRLRS